MPLVRITDDEMAADLILADGEEVGSSNVAIVLLARNGVRHGLQHPSLAMLPTLRGPTALRVALGDPALPGRAGRVVYGFPVACPSAVPTPPGLPLPAPCGAALARRHAADLGQIGRTVTGRTLPIEPVSEPPFEAGAGAEVTMDGAFMVATRPGVPHLEDGKVCVRPLLEREGDLDGAEAALSFDGDVVIAGHVEHPAEIFATGDVHVLGGVQGARIRADGWVVVHGGVRHEARIEGGAGVAARFVEQSTIVAQGPVIIHEDAVRAVVEAPSATIGGAVVGGDLSIGAWLEAHELGSAFAAPTRVAVVPPPPPDDPGRQFLRERREIEEQLARLAPLLDENRRLAKDPRNDGAREMAVKLVGVIAHLQARDQALAAMLAEVPLPPPGPRPYVRVSGCVYPGVSLQVGAEHLRPTGVIMASTLLDGAGAVEIVPFDLLTERIPV